MFRGSASGAYSVAFEPDVGDRRPTRRIVWGKPGPDGAISRQGGFNWGVKIFMSTAQQFSLTDLQVTLISRALADRRRYQILVQIGASDEPVPCAALLKVHPVSAATVSHHTKELERAGLIATLREGKYASFQIRREVLHAYARQLMHI
ncbi:DNA-binding transcriptional regulator, ArsR family [Pseudomonas sp. NFR16]|nr:DNA-binding transcriptional regulator, ArsR family [Pseudomonas sp. NFR16]